MSADIVKYYRMKAAYENKIAKKKRAIMADPTLDRSEKQRRVARATGACPNCKKPGGMRFERRGTMLVATCGAAPSCTFSMTVDRGQHENIRKIEADVVEEVRKLESDVIRTKLDLLFGFSSQEEAVAHFEVLRPNLKATGERLEVLRRQYWRTVTRAGDHAKLKVADSELALAKEELARTGTDAPDDARKAASIYVDTIRPLVERIRRLKYARSTVRTELREDPTEEVDILDLDPYTLEELVVNDADGTEGATA